MLDTVVNVKTIPTPTEVDHYQLFRVIDVYVSPKTEDLGRVSGQIDKIIANTKLPEGVRVNLRGSVQNMRSSFKSFGIGLILAIVLVTGTTLNVMSLMGVVMMVGIVVSNSILIVEFTRQIRHQGTPLREAVATASRQRLRPVLMTSLATLLGLIPMALALGTGSEAYAPLARAIIGGLLVSVVVTVYLVPAAYLWFHRSEEL